MTKLIYTISWFGYSINNQFFYNSKRHIFIGVSFFCEKLAQLEFNIYFSRNK